MPCDIRWCHTNKSIEWHSSSCPTTRTVASWVGIISRIPQTPWLVAGAFTVGFGDQPIQCDIFTLGLPILCSSSLDITRRVTVKPSYFCVTFNTRNFHLIVILAMSKLHHKTVRKLNSFSFTQIINLSCNNLLNLPSPSSTKRTPYPGQHFNAANLRTPDTNAKVSLSCATHKTSTFNRNSTSFTSRGAIKGFKACFELKPSPATQPLPTRYRIFPITLL